MRKALFSGALMILLAPALAAEGGQSKSAQKIESAGTSCHGTAVEFVDTPVAAAKLAAGQKKLVFVLHVSGYFEDPQFT
jgi:hypothetical protein